MINSSISRGQYLGLAQSEASIEVILAVSTNQRPLSRPTFYMSHYGYAVYKPLIYFDGLLDHWLILGDWGAVAAGDQP